MSSTIYPLQSSTSILSSKATQTTKPVVVPFAEDKLYPAPTPSPKFTISKPKLPAPSTNIIYTILNSVSNLWNVGQDRLQLQLQLLDRNKQTLNNLTLEHTKSIKESAKKTQDGKVWSLLKKIGGCILAAFSIFLGTTVASPLLSGLLIASGILALANLILVEAGLWDRIADKLFPDNRESRQKFLSYVPAAVGILSAVCGTVGTVGAFFTVGLNLYGGIVNIANTAVGLAQGVTSIGEGLNRGSVLFSEAKIKQLEKELFSQQNELNKITGGFEGVVRVLSQSYAKTARIVQMAIRTGEEVTLQA